MAFKIKKGRLICTIRRVGDLKKCESKFKKIKKKK